MGDQKIDGGKRTWIIASGCAGAVGAGFVAVPFVSSFEPSERARAAGAPVEADIGGLQPGEKMTVAWRGKPVWIVRRTPEQLAELAKIDGELADPGSKRTTFSDTPEYARNDWRSIKPEYLVVDRHLHPPRLLARRQVHARRRSRRCRPTGRAGSCAPATARPSTWPAASSRTSRRPTTSKCLPTCTCPTAGSSSAKTRRPEPRPSRHARRRLLRRKKNG